MLFRKRKSRLPAVGARHPDPPAPPEIQKYTPFATGLSVTSISLIGGRSSQQDALDYRILSAGSLAAVVCDGMGGLNGGAQAAHAACQGFFEEYEKCTAAGQEPPDLRQIARSLDRRVLALHDTDGLPLDGGSTLTAVVIQDRTLHWLSVGDSRIGLLRNGQMLWLNRLHNYRLELDEALNSGDISPAEYEAELPRGAALLSYLGCGELKYIDCQTACPLMPSNMLLLCSDGFYDLLPGEALPSVLEALDETMGNLPELLSPFLGRAGRNMDNASAVIIRCQSII